MADEFASRIKNFTLNKYGTKTLVFKKNRDCYK